MKKDDESDLHTMLAWRISERTANRWRDVFLLFGFMIIFLFGASLLGAFQYFVLCKPKFPDASLTDCISLEVYTKRGKGK